MINYLEYAKTSIDCYVVVPGEGAAAEWFRVHDIKCFVIPFSRGYGRIGKTTAKEADLYFSDNYEAAQKIADIIRQERIDIVHSNSSVSDVGAIAAMLSGAGHVWHVRELMEEDFDVEYYDKNLKKALFEASDSVISISDTVRESLQKKYSIKSSRIYNGVRLCGLDNIDKKNNSEFIFVGKITENKGQFDAAYAAKELINRGVKDFKIYFLGGGSPKAIWAIKRYLTENRLERNIELVPFTNDISYWREKCGYAIVGSKCEALGRITIEAMAAGNIPIGSNSGGTLELIGDEKRGLLYNFGDYCGLAYQMEKAMSMSSEERAKIEKAMKSYVYNTFSIEKYSEKILSVYKDVISNSPNDIKRKRIIEYLDNRYGMISATKKQEVRNNDVLKEQCLNNLNSILIFLQVHRIGKVVIYGMGEVGCALYDYISTHGIQIGAVMDEDDGLLSRVTQTIKVGEGLHDAECILVSTIREEKMIMDTLQSYYDIPVYGLASIIGMENEKSN